MKFISIEYIVIGMERKKSEKVLPEEARKMLKDRFKEMENPVSLYVFTEKRKNNQINDITQKFTQELMEITGKI
jgi:hypothetical protein